MMRKRLITASLCALGVAGIAAGPASAAHYGDAPSSVQVFGAQGLVRTIACPTPTAAPECAGTQASIDGIARELNMSIDGKITATVAGFQFLDAQGQWFFSAANNDASEAVIQQFDKTGNVTSTAQATTAKAVAAAKKKAPPKKAAKHHRKGSKH
jgi:hypothetical protein